MYGELPHPKRKDAIQALVRLLVNRLVAERGAIHRSCAQKGWSWKKTGDESMQLDQIDHALTELGFFSTAPEGGRTT